MEKLKMKSFDNFADNVSKIEAMFPDCVSETIDKYGCAKKAIDFEKLKAELSGEIIDTKKERYGFSWPDKRQAIITANTPITKTLRPCREKSVNFDQTQNVYIEGDNLDALKLLQETYLGKIDLIYIDPPYNTGNNLIYKNDFSSDLNQYMKISGQIDKEGNCLVPNPTSNGRFHTDWLNMIFPRLRLAKNLLTEDGVIVLTIDDCEIETITMVMNEVFGESNHLATIVIKNNPSGRSTTKGASIAHEYALFYGKGCNVRLGRLQRSDKQISRYKESDEIGPFEWVNFRARYSTESPKMAYPIFVKKDGSDFRIPDMTWNEYSKEYSLKESASADEFISLPIDENGNMRSWKWSISTAIQSKKTEMMVRKNQQGQPAVYVKARMNQEGMLPLTVWDDSKYSSTEFGTNLLTSLMGKRYFDYPKSLYAVEDCLRIGCSKKDFTVLDFFSGSATTAHAMMDLNKEDGGTRKFILVQLAEKTSKDSDAYKDGFKSICDIGEERIRKVGNKERLDADLMTENLDVGFRVFKIDDSNMKDIYYRPDEFQQDLLSSVESNIKEDRTPEDLLFQVMIDDFGIPLSAKIETLDINEKKVFNVENGHLVACFDTGVTDEVITAMAKLEPNYAVLRDSSYESDSVAANFEQIFKKFSPNTIKKVI